MTRKWLTAEDAERLLDEEDLESSDDEYLSSDDGEVDHVSDYASSDSSVESDSEDVPLTTAATSFLSRNKSVCWSSNPVEHLGGRAPVHNIIHTTPGPSRFANRQCGSVVDSFMLFLRQPLLETIRKWTNAEGEVVYNREWKNLDAEEFKNFIGVVILIGVYKSGNENATQLWSKDNGRPIFNKIMSRARFQQILRVLRFDDAKNRRRNRSLDKLQPIREVFDTWDSYLRDAYIPGACMTVDEQLLCFRGRCPFRQYIPSKPGKYGIKIWTICDSNTFYAWKMQVYLGKNDNAPREVNQSTRVVLDMTKEIELSGRNITCDNFFTSLSLARNLLDKKLTIVGTLRKNKPELPPQFTVAKGREAKSTLFGFQDDAMIASYCPKKYRIVPMLSTMHSQPDIDANSSDQKPEVILYYNATKGGVDTLDRMVRTYTCKRMTRRWPVVLFYNMIDVSAVNAFIVWLELNGESPSISVKKRRNFLLELGKELAGVNTQPDLSQRVSVPSASAQKRRNKNDLGNAPKLKRQRCSLCDRSKDKKTSLVCYICKKYVCSGHSKTICHQCC